ncbi:azurin [Nibricoccus sp. IMCC34717]|uniref:azurin n=1 Tax=Nibricoccus sp. IMCC34717 TaxID=3034021 RepID=UPI00384C14BC
MKKIPTFLLSLGILLASLGVAARASEAPREIAITANDAMQYSLKEITAAPGETITVKFSHIGKLPKTAMGHNWVLLKALPADAVSKFAMECMKFAPDYLPKDQSAILAHTKLLSGGESDSVTFTVPTEPGQYPFICTFPGHFAMMRGNLTVK